MLCDDLVGWDWEGGREPEEGGDMGTCVCIWLIHFGVQQKLTWYCKAIILQKRSIEKKKSLVASASPRTSGLDLVPKRSYCR